MRSTIYDRIGCSVEFAFGRRRAEGDCGSSKEGYQAQRCVPPCIPTTRPIFALRCFARYSPEALFTR
eukprot:365602-Chlamydomonas_euryale.AAC.7